MPELIDRKFRVGPLLKSKRALRNNGLFVCCLWLSLPVFWPLVPTQGTEICNNAVDDDGDGFIDLNDTDCFCPPNEFLSLVPNPSFEERECCPDFSALLDCAALWSQASPAYVHYFHDCAFTNFLIPQPIPDGGGVVALTNGRIKEISNYKEYLGTCLLEPMTAGAPYKFQFQLGISAELKVMPMNVSLFGTPSCDHLPFGGSSDTIGCPTNDPNWIYLGEALATTIPGWHKKEINFTPDSDIAAIAIGPPCIPNDWRDSTASAYYFFDELNLAKAYNFDFEITASDHFCSDDLQFEVPYFENLNYQWYKDGVALLNETNNTLHKIVGDGIYQVRIEDADICFLSEGLAYSNTTVYEDILDTLCKGGIYLFQGKQLSAPGQYQDTIKTADNCDSILRLVLIDAVVVEKEVQAKFFPFETYFYAGLVFSEPGIYRFPTAVPEGCDELVNLTLEYYQVYAPNVFSPNGDGVNDVFTLYGNEDLELILSLRIFDRWGGGRYTNRKTYCPTIRVRHGMVRMEGLKPKKGCLPTQPSY